MSEQVADQVDGIDYALAAYREDGVWRLDEIADPFLVDFEALVSGLRRFPGDSGALGLISVDEDFFLLLRVNASAVRVLLSDVTASEDWLLAQDAVDLLGLPVPDDEEDQVPAGDLDLLADLGMPALDLGALLDQEGHPDDVLGEVAERLGFGELFDDAVSDDDDDLDDD